MYPCLVNRAGRHRSPEPQGEAPVAGPITGEHRVRPSAAAWGAARGARGTSEKMKVVVRSCLRHRLRGAEGRGVRPGNIRGGRGRCGSHRGARCCVGLLPRCPSAQQAQRHPPHLQPHRWYHLLGFTKEKVSPLSAERRLPLHRTVLRFWPHF